MSEETPKPQEQTVSLLDEARAIRDDIIKTRDELKAEREKLEKVKAEALLSGTAGGRPEMPPAKEETAKEYARKILGVR